jgi:hypothetical protein
LYVELIPLASTFILTDTETDYDDRRLGEKLAGLSKEVQKEVKSKDADRVARRKKARMSIGSKPPGRCKEGTGIGRGKLVLEKVESNLARR